MGELIKHIPKKVKILYVNQRLGYGKPLDLLLELSPRGNVLLLEDDTIIFKKGVVKKYFDLLDEYDLIGSPRMSCPQWVADQQKEWYDLDYSGYGDKGCSFWPAFLWIKKSLLLQTDRNFDPTEYGDCFVWASIQLRKIIHERGGKILEIPQYHCSPDDLANKEAGRGIFDGECGYIHLGSLSSGIESYLLDNNDVPLTDRQEGTKSINPEPIEHSNEMCRRFMWWKHCFNKSRGLLPEFDPIYEASLNRISPIFSQEEVNKWEELYLRVIMGEK